MLREIFLSDNAAIIAIGCIFSLLLNSVIFMRPFYRSLSPSLSRCSLKITFILRKNRNYFKMFEHSHIQSKYGERFILFRFALFYLYFQQGRCLFLVTVEIYLHQMKIFCRNSLYPSFRQHIRQSARFTCRSFFCFAVFWHINCRQYS